MIVKVLDVGHGLCVHIVGQGTDFVFDCGTHGNSGVERVPKAWTALSRSLRGRRGLVDAIAVSHLHWDHYCGFLEPVPGIAHDVLVTIPRIPVLADATPLRNRFAAALLSLAPLDSSLGPLDIDLLRRIKRYAPAARPNPVSAGDPVDAANDQWEVLWPPPRIESGTRGLTKIERAVTAYEEAARNSPETRRRLDAVRESETFHELLSEPLDGSDDEPRRKPNVREEHDDLDSLIDDDEGDDNAVLHHGADDDEPDGLEIDRDLAAAAAAVRDAANDLSLIMVSTNSRVLLTGDATRYAMSRAMQHAGRDFNLVVTPHHGGRRHLPVSLRAAKSPFWASSAGGRIGRQVSQDYDWLGKHHRTDLDGDAAFLLEWDWIARGYFPWVKGW